MHAWKGRVVGKGAVGPHPHGARGGRPRPVGELAGVDRSPVHAATVVLLAGQLVGGGDANEG